MGVRCVFAHVELERLSLLDADFSPHLISVYAHVCVPQCVSVREVFFVFAVCVSVLCSCVVFVRGK